MKYLLFILAAIGLAALFLVIRKWSERKPEHSGVRRSPIFEIPEEWLNNPEYEIFMPNH